jgi:glutamine synthetase
MVSKAEYIWIDGFGKLRSKTKILPKGVSSTSLKNFPEWGFDGSSTGQASGDNSDVILKPVFVCRDPIRKTDDYFASSYGWYPHPLMYGYPGESGNYLVLCETYDADGSPNKTNHRQRLVKLMDERNEEFKPLMGIEQEYVFMKSGRVLGWPEQGYPAPQGPFYCGVGSDEVFGREIVEGHLQACLDAGLPISGINAEVMPGQWEIQVGCDDPLKVSDSLWVARWLLYRIAEEHGVSVTLHPKPVRGNWNGSGCHTNFSTENMRIKTKSEEYRQAIDRAAEGKENVKVSVPVTGMKAIKRACNILENNIEKCLAVYGADNEQRLTGLHETCSIKDFKWGVADRGASVRIPLHVSQKRCGYLEDRRPASNIDPYQVSAVLVELLCVK